MKIEAIIYIRKIFDRMSDILWYVFMCSAYDLFAWNATNISKLPLITPYPFLRDIFIPIGLIYFGYLGIYIIGGMYITEYYEGHNE